MKEIDDLFPLVLYVVSEKKTVGGITLDKGQKIWKMSDNACYISNDAIAPESKEYLIRLGSEISYVSFVDVLDVMWTNDLSVVMEDG